MAGYLQQFDSYESLAAGVKELCSEIITPAPDKVAYEYDLISLQNRLNIYIGPLGISIWVTARDMISSKEEFTTKVLSPALACLKESYDRSN